MRFGTGRAILSGASPFQNMKTKIRPSELALFGALLLLVSAGMTGCASPGNLAPRVVLHPVDNPIPPPKAGVYDARSVDVPPILVSKSKPRYPQELKSVGGGEAVVLFTVCADGSVTDASIVKADDILFGESAMEAILKARFRPARVNSVAVDCRMKTPFIFTYHSYFVSVFNSIFPGFSDPDRPRFASPGVSDPPLGPGPPDQAPERPF